VPLLKRVRVRVQGEACIRMLSALHGTGRHANEIDPCTSIRNLLLARSFNYRMHAHLAVSMARAHVYTA
jgi:hypothetical protein